MVLQIFMNSTAILLAAGASERMGTTKQLVSITDKPLLLHTLEPLLESRLAKVVLVLGHNHKEILKQIPSSEKLITVINNNYAHGISSSVKTGMAHLEPNTDTIMIALADQPFITTQIINNLLEHASETTKKIIAPVWQGERGHPVIFKKKYFHKLMKLYGDKGGSSILKNHPYDLLLIAVKTDAILFDIDTTKDLETAIRKISLL